MQNENTHRINSRLCPSCRKLVSIDEAKCPHCGLAKPGSRWKHSVLTRGFSSGERLLHTLILVNVVMYLCSLLMSGRGLHLSANPMTFLSPSNQGLILLGATGTIPIDHLNRWWTLVSASYLHGGILHIGFNMLALRQIGPLVIDEYGAHRMTVIYTLSGVGGFLISYLARVSLTIGASAALCGLIGATLYYGKRRGGVYGQALFRQVGGWAIGIALFGLVVPGINNWAHGGGMAAGILLGLLMGFNEQRRETWLHRLLSGMCLWGTGLILLWAVAVAVLVRI